MIYDYKPEEPCSCHMKFDIDVETRTIRHLIVNSPCEKGLKNLCDLIEGKKIEDVIDRLDGLKINNRYCYIPIVLEQLRKRYDAAENI
jgi:hypothetical protein